MAAAEAVLDVVADPLFLEEVKAKGERLRGRTGSGMGPEGEGLEGLEGLDQGRPRQQRATGS